MPHLTVAQNIFIGREPRRRLGFSSTSGELNAQAAASSSSCCTSTSIRGTRVGRPDRGQAADGRDRQGAVLQLRRPDHGRADRGADRHRDRRAVPDHPRSSREQGVGHRLHLAPARGAEADLRPRHRHARRPATSTRSPTADATIDQIISHDGRAGPSTRRRPRSPSTPSREVVLEVQRPATAGASIQDVSFQLAARRDPRLRRADGRRPDRGGARHLRRRPARVGRDPRSTASRSTIRTPARRRAPRHRLPVRGPQALRPRPRHGRRDQHRAGLAAPLPAAGWAGSGRPTTRASARAVRRAALRDQDAHASQQQVQQPLRRQPAEGGRRQVADRRHATSSSSTSRPAASTSAPRARSTSCSTTWPSRARPSS